MKRVKFGQIWLAKLSYFHDNPEFISVIQILGENWKGIMFRNLEAEDAWEVKHSKDMQLFDLIRKIKD